MVLLSSVHGEHMAELNSKDLFEDGVTVELCECLLGVTGLDFLLIKIKGRHKCYTTSPRCSLVRTLYTHSGGVGCYRHLQYRIWFPLSSCHTAIYR